MARNTNNKNQRTFYALILIMVAISAGVGGLTFRTLYKEAFNQQLMRLKEIAKNHVRMVKTASLVARSKQAAVVDVLAGNENDLKKRNTDIASQLKAAHEQFENFGRSGEVILVKREDDHIVILAQSGHHKKQNEKFSYHSVEAAPMRNALSGKAGTYVGLDHSGLMVCAAYEPIIGLDLGVVAQIDLEEVRKPLIRAGLNSGLDTLLLMLVGTLLFIRIGYPLFRQLSENK